MRSRVAAMEVIPEMVTVRKSPDHGTVFVAQVVVRLAAFSVPVRVVHWLKGVGPVPRALSVEETNCCKIFKSRINLFKSVAPIHQPLTESNGTSFSIVLGKWSWCDRLQLPSNKNKLAKLGDAIAISNLKLSMTHWPLTHSLTGVGAWRCYRI